jgi:putative phosphoribosyl transferase
MKDRFRDRIQAGEFLATRLQRYAERGDAVVLGLPRGGISVDAEIAIFLSGALRKPCTTALAAIPRHGSAGIQRKWNVCSAKNSLHKSLSYEC